jgi:hypothetical protein
MKGRTMTQITKTKVKRVTKEMMKSLLNYGMFSETIKEYTKQNKLMKPEYLSWFDDLKTNLIILKTDVMGNGFEGFAQKINRKSKRFDVTSFKEKYPDIYEQFLIPSESMELKVEYKVAGGVNV